MPGLRLLGGLALLALAVLAGWGLVLWWDALGLGEVFGSEPPPEAAAGAARGEPRGGAEPALDPAGLVGFVSLALLALLLLRGGLFLVWDALRGDPLG